MSLSAKYKAIGGTTIRLTIKASMVMGLWSIKGLNF